MSLICPNCQKTISPFKVRGHFSCPACHSFLSSNFWRLFPLVLLVVVASEALVLYVLALFVSAHIFNDSLAFLVWLISIGMAGSLTYWVCFNFFCKFEHAQ